MRQSFCAHFSALKRCLVDLLAAEVLRFAQDDDAMTTLFVVRR
jgi:hypothetical protein